MSKRRRAGAVIHEDDDEPSTSTQTAQATVAHSEVGGLIGKIKSVYCKHFVTYEECTFHPTEYLNIIIGPNGTGKSTLVAAIVLGLGGEPKLLSRSSSIQDYIKNGRTTAVIKIEIYTKDTGKTVVFHRTFSEGKSEYQVNEDVVSKNKFLAAIAIYKIQINNLCQFLPQDRVQDFAKMNPQEIMQNTINSVCSQKVIDEFAQLKDLRRKQLDGQKTQATNMQQLQESMQRVDELKMVLERYNARKEYLEKLNVCNAKKAWLEVDEVKAKAEEHTVDLSAAKERFEERKQVYDEIVKKEKAIAETTAKLTAAAVEKERSEKVVLENKNKIANEIEELMKKIREAKSMFERKKRERAECEKDLQNETRLLQVIVQDLSNAKAAIGSDAERLKLLKEYEQSIQSLKAEYSRHLKTRSDINRKLDEEYSAEIQMLKNRIERSKNFAEQKLSYIRNNNPNLYNAVRWLEANRDMFQGEVYKPMILELNVLEPNNAKYFENTISGRDLFSFTCENKSDVSTLIEELCVKQKLQINVGHAPAANECHYTPNIPIANLEKFGFTAYLIDLIEGPPAILNYLCSLYNLQNIPIGSERVNNHTDAIPSEIRLYFGGDLRFNASTSKYSNELSLMQNRIERRNLLSSVDVNAIQMDQRRLKELLVKSDSLKNQRTTVEATLNEIESRRTEVVNKKRANDAKTARLEQLKAQSKKQEHKIAQLNTNIISVPEMENTFTTTVHQHLRKILQLEKQKIDTLKIFQKATADKKFSKTRVHIYKQQNDELTNAISEANDHKTQAQKLVDAITKALETSKRNYKVKLLQAKGLSNDCRPQDADFPFKDMFRALPNNMEELKAQINEYSARLDCMGDIDQHVVTEYDARSADVEMLKKAIEESCHGNENIEADITAIYTDWIPEISKVVDTLNQHFGDFMASMSYVGEVLLAKGNDYDFDSYGIQIMVQYRKNVQLQALDRHVQSGGERAVAIAVYTLSLQHITHVPFRCVDEINQGMDARNERKIFDMLIEETTQTGRAQYFFVTPKLLPNLKCENDRMSVHVVFNGKMMQPRNAFSFNM